jgi:hypothetical protein
MKDKPKGFSMTKTRRTFMKALVATGVAGSVLGNAKASASAAPTTAAPIDPAARLSDFQVLEFRRYSIKQGERGHFAEFFDTYFPEAFQQVGTVVAGSFLERKNQSVFTWIRGCHTNEDRGIASAEFYYGSVWKEHRKAANDFIASADNDLLLRPLKPDRGISILPAVHVIDEPKGAQGVIVAEIFAVKTNDVEAFAQAAEPTFAGYRAAGAREAGVLVSLDAPNTFPQLSLRSDGPFLIWLGILKDDSMLETYTPLAERSLQTLSATGLLRGTPELVTMDPTRRSRLRWMP